MLEKYYKIKAVNEEGGAIELVIPAGCNIEDMADSLRLILKWMTFSDETINEVMPDEDTKEEIYKDITNMVRSEIRENKRTKKT